jgi:hypothetical protein
MRVLLFVQPDDEDSHLTHLSLFEHPHFSFRDALKFTFSFGFLEEWDNEDLESSVPHGFERNVINVYSHAAFYIFSMFTNIILLNLLIAIIGDSYNRVKDNEAVTRRIQRAKTLCEIDRVWGSYWLDRISGRADEFYPKCLHVLTKKDDFGNIMHNDTSREGKLHDFLSSITSSIKETFKEENGQLAHRVEGRLRMMEQNINSKLEIFEGRLLEMESVFNANNDANLLRKNRMLSKVKFISTKDGFPIGPPCRVLNAVKLTKMEGKVDEIQVCKKATPKSRSGSTLLRSSTARELQ